MGRSETAIITLEGKRAFRGMEKQSQREGPNTR